ncbi:MAG: hypothetical protein M3237_10005 [Actinomycetota bacterium]|nr:hypothetical protein [Actinomycetota bacterium]
MQLDRPPFTMLTSLVAVIGLALGTAAVTTPARSAVAAGDCTETFPLAELTPGAVVEGWTVERGTQPALFTGEVLGVLHDGIAPGIDMVMAELDSPALDAAGGIWQGMSGSPVYAGDGRLIGAVAYGLAHGPSPIAGITPFAEMDDYLVDEPPAAVEVPARMAQRIADATEVTEQEAAQGVHQLAMPLGVSGLGAGRLARVDRSGRAYLPDNTYAAGGVTGSAGPEAIVAGGNLGASYSYGDITQAGVGTATYVCADRVVGFGHPMRFSGGTTMSMHPAEAVYVQPDSLGGPFKVANLSAPVGAVTEDRLAGITGAFGNAPSTIEVSSEVTFGSRSRTGTSLVSEDGFAAGTTFYQQIANHDRVVDAVGGGSEEQSWTITGTGPDGAAFSLGFTDRYVSTWDLSYEVSYPLADLVALLTEAPGVTIESVTANAQVSEDESTFRIRRVEQWRGGGWTALTPRQPALVRAGKTLRIRTMLVSQGRTVTMRSSFAVPRKAAGTRARLSVVGGDNYFSDGFFYEEFEEEFEDEFFGFEESSAPTLKEIQKMVAGMLRNDEVWAGLRFGRGRAAVTRERVLGMADRVVRGYSEVKVLIR